jgi:hypothetical protein
MWKVKKFKTKELADKWLENNGHKVQWEQIFVNNVPFAINYRLLRKVY